MDLQKRKFLIELLEPTIITDGGPWALHDMPCAVCLVKPAVYDLGNGTFQPCWNCQIYDWQLVKRRKRWWKLWS